MTAPLVIPVSDLAALKLAGFAAPVQKPLKPPRLCIASSGKTKCGKTHWAIMTAPDPLAHIMADPGALLLADKAIARGRKIYPMFIAHSKKESKEEAEKLWQSYRKAIRTVLATKALRTLVIDTESEMWELLQMAEFGKLKQNNKFAYGPLNAEFAGLIEDCYYSRADLNLIYIQKVKKVYQAKKSKKESAGEDMGGEWTGEMEPKGYKDLDYMVDVNIIHGFADKEFFFETKASEATRFGAESSGLKFSGPECSFPDLAMHIFGDPQKAKELGFSDAGCDPEYWGVTL